MAPLEIVLLDEGDLGEVLTLQRAAFALEVLDSYPGYTQPLRQTLEELQEEQSSPSAAALGVRDNHRLVAAIRIIPETSDTVLLARLSVAPDRARQGLGKALMEAAINHVKRSMPQVKRIQFHADGDNGWIIRWYESLGFQVVREGTEHAPGDWVLEMRI